MSRNPEPGTEPTDDPVFDAWIASVGMGPSPYRYRSFKFWRMARHVEGIEGRESLLVAARRAVPQSNLA